MKILFVHNNFPAQFRRLAEALAQDPRNEVVAIGCQTARKVGAVQVHRYNLPSGNPAQVHPFARRFDSECHRAEQVLYVAASLKAGGFVPDLVYVHPGWGEALPLRSIFRESRIAVYCEFFYKPEGLDVGFDPESAPLGTDGLAGLAGKNAMTLLALVDADIAIAPTRWQKATFPQVFQDKVTVVHDGVDTDFLHPDSAAVLRLESGQTFSSQDEVVTYVARNLEPLRGCHIVLRALPELLRERPNCRVLIIGGDQISYGPSAPNGRTWKDVYLAEVADRIDRERVIFTGPLSYSAYLNALQISKAHVYLTYPFVLSWSFIEALSVGCPVIGSDTGPVRDIIGEGGGLLVPFFDHRHLAQTIAEVLATPALRADLGRSARELAVRQFDFQRVCWPELKRLLGV